MQTKIIESRQNPLVKKLYQLTHKTTAYQTEKLIWLEGEHLCQSYQQKKGPPLSIVCSQDAVEKYQHLLEAEETLYLLPDQLFQQISKLQSADGIAYLIPYVENRSEINNIPTIILDRLQDPGNIGNILRSASAFNYKQILALKGTCALWSDKVLRAGMGAHFSLTLIEQLELDELSQLTIPFIITSSHASHYLHNTTVPTPCAWILGHEGQGVSPELANKSTLTLCIQQPGGEESLNVATAASICMYESLRQSL